MLSFVNSVLLNDDLTSTNIAMQKKTWALLICAVSFTTSLLGFCPDKDSLWNELDSIKNFPNPSAEKQLQQLLSYEIEIKNCPSYQYDSTHAFLLQRIAVTYSKMGDYLKALQYTHQAINFITANAHRASINVKHNILNYYLLYVFNSDLKNIPEKMKALDSCVWIAIRLKAVNIFCLFGLYQRAQFFFDLGDYQRCMTYINMGEINTREYAHGKDSAAYIFYFLGMKIEVQFILKNYDFARALLVNKIDECKKAKAENYLGTIYRQLAIVELNKEDYPKALSYFQQAIKFESKYGNNLNCKAIMGNIGYRIYFKHLNNLDSALFCYKKGLQYTNKDNSQAKLDSIETSNILVDIANVYVQKRWYDSAFYYFSLAFDQVKKGITEKDLLDISLDEFAQLRKIDYLTSLLMDKGDAFLNQFITTKKTSAIDDAIRVYKITDKLLGRIRTEQSEFQSKLFWRSDTRRLYEHAIEACYLAGNKNDAFYFFEQGHAVLLNEQINEQHLAGEEDILKQVQARKKIIQLEEEFNNLNTSSTRYGEVQTELFNYKQELDRLSSVIKEHNPLYYQNFLDKSSITLQDAQKNILKDHQALLELFAGDSAVYALFITAGHVYLNKISKNDFDATVHSYIAYISNLSLLNSRLDDYIQTANHLYRLIFRDNPVPAGRIIISPDGNYFPFEALVTTISSSPVYFINDHAVSYTYSARYLMNDFAANTSAVNGNFFGVAPVQYTADSFLASLQGSDLSLLSIGSYFDKTNNLIAGQATKNNFLQQFSKYSIIQLYTHGSDTSTKHEPVIYFSDSALYLSELIAENKPLTRLIVLSACETGIGKLYQGEGVFSFNRGFAAIGIPTSISNLWAVDNQPTYALTEMFYKYLSESLPVDIALQKAKLQFMHASRKNRLPYYWAAAIITGKTEVLVEKNKNNWKYIAMALIVLIALSFYSWRNWQKRKN